MNEELKKDTADNFTMELLREFKAQQKGRTIISAISIIGLVIVVLFCITFHYKSEQGWQELFGSYDYVSQDGEGYNYYNSDIGGNVNNGMEE